MIANRKARLCFAAGLVLALPSHALAAPNRDFPLGQSASGAVCEAQQEFDDPAIQQRGARAWTIHCRGYSAIFGRLYVFERNGPASVGPKSQWAQALPQRAACAAPQSMKIQGLSSATQALCKSVPGNVPYVVVESVNGDTAAIAEGFAPLNDLVEAGLKIVTEVSPVPQSALQAQPLGEYGTNGGAGATLADAVNAAQQTSDWLKNRAHVENQGWLFGDAERDFRSLASSDNVSDQDRAYAQLNVALNVSNQGRFGEADKRFAEALATAQKLHDKQFDALALNYQALHFVNQRRFADALATAQKAVALREEIDPAVEMQADIPTIEYRENGRDIQISSVLASRLNERERATGFKVVRLTPTERLQIQNEQARYVIGISQAQLGQDDAARKTLEQVDTDLSNPRWVHSGAFLKAETLGALARLDFKQKKPDDAAARYQAAIKVFSDDKNLVASPAQANLFLGLAESESLTGHQDSALQDYKTGFDVFRESRRSLGDSRNAAGPYFDLLIKKIASDPANTRHYQDEFFDVSQIVMGQATAETLAQLSARVSKGDERSSTLARQLDDTQRQIAIKIAQIKHDQDTGANAAQDQADLKLLNREAETLQQQLLEANPHYGQVVEETATLDKMQQALGPGELYVKTVLLANGGYAIAISHDTVTAYAVPVTRSDAETVVKKLRLPFDADVITRFDVSLSHRLFAALFGPIEDKVRAAKHLIYEPDSSMVSLPASVFVTDQASVDMFKKRKAQDPRGLLDLDLYQGIAWLGRTTDVSLTVSATAFLQTRSIKPSKAPRPFVAFGDPNSRGPEPRRYALLVDPNDTVSRASCERLRALWANTGPGALEGIAQTIETVGARFKASSDDLVLGQPFTDQSVMDRKNLGSYRVVFFGTHAVLPANHPCLPEAVLVTSLGPGASDGFLDEGEILQLKLDADMVVLAACDTGGAGASATDKTGLSGSGDELSGLARDFIYAGARSLLVSQWPVEAKATSQLMAHFFGPGSENQSDALRKAEVTLMDEKATSHPYYWAGFSLVGDGSRAMPGG